MGNSTCVFLTPPCTPMLLLLLLMFVSVAMADFAKDRDQCADQLVGLATCLPYVGGDAKAPTLDCCAGIKQVLQQSKICLCILVKDRNDPNLGLKINATLALGLPSSCHAPANITDCPSMLHLPPHSPGAKVFEDYVNSTKSSTGSTPATTSATTPATTGKGSGSSAAAINSSDGGSRKKWMGVEMALGLFLITLFFPLLPNISYSEI